MYEPHNRYMKIKSSSVGQFSSFFISFFFNGSNTFCNMTYIIHICLKKKEEEEKDGRRKTVLSFSFSPNSVSDIPRWTEESFALPARIRLSNIYTPILCANSSVCWSSNKNG